MCKSVNSRFSRLLQKSFKGWKFFTVYNEKERQRRHKIRADGVSHTKSHYFMAWLRAALNSWRVKVQYRKGIARRAFDGLLRFVEMREQWRMIKKRAVKQRPSRLARGVLNAFSRNLEKAQCERNYRKTVFSYMEQFKRKQVLSHFKSQCTS